MGFLGFLRKGFPADTAVKEDSYLTKYYGPAGKHGEFKTLASMVKDYAQHHGTLTDEEKKAKLTAFWNRWDDLVGIKQIREKSK